MTARVTSYDAYKFGNNQIAFFLGGWTDILPRKLYQDFQQHLDMFGTKLGNQAWVLQPADPFDPFMEAPAREIFEKPWPHFIKQLLDPSIGSNDVRRRTFLLIIDRPFQSFDPDIDNAAIIWLGGYENDGSVLLPLFNICFVAIKLCGGALFTCLNNLYDGLSKTRRDLVEGKNAIDGEPNLNFKLKNSERFVSLDAVVFKDRWNDFECRRSSYLVDLCVVTALPDPELAAITDLNWAWQPSRNLDEDIFITEGHFSSGDETYSVIAVAADGMGMVESALLTSKLITHMRPRFLVMAGICGGMKGKVNIGDVICADVTWNWQSGKIQGDGQHSRLQIAPYQISIPRLIRSRIDQLSGQVDVWAQIRNKWQAPKPKTDLVLRRGPMATGSPVIDDPSLKSALLAQHRKTLAVEMETYGVYAAAEIGKPRPITFALKSVCDFADGSKNDEHQRYASYTSAQAVRVFFETYMKPLQDDVPTG
jgi:nucleoside phosphorylase